MAANSTVSGPVWLKFEPLKIPCISSLHASLKSIGSIEKKSEDINFLSSRAANSVVNGQVWLKYELIYNLRCVFTLPASIKRIGSNQPRKETPFPHYKSVWIYFRHSRADNSIPCGPIWPKFEPSQILCMSLLLLTNLKWIGLIATEKKWRH